MKHELKAIHHESVPRALEKAERYRLLNEPFLAESICLDILALEPAHQKALVCYVLALSDQFAFGRGESLVQRARAAVEKLEGEYEKLYYSGLIAERRAHAYVEGGGMGARDAAWESLHDAMQYYDQALAKAPEHNDDAILRWNTCVRLIETHRLTAPAHDHTEYPLE
jgi:hypothetical protein